MKYFLALIILIASCKSKEVIQKEKKQQVMLEIRKLAAPNIANDWQEIDDEMKIIRDRKLSMEERENALEEFHKKFRNINPFVLELALKDYTDFYKKQNADIRKQNIQERRFENQYGLKHSKPLDTIEYEKGIIIDSMKPENLDYIVQVTKDRVKAYWMKKSADDLKVEMNKQKNEAAIEAGE